MDDKQKIERGEDLILIYVEWNDANVGETQQLAHNLRFTGVLTNGDCWESAGELERVFGAKAQSSKYFPQVLPR